MTVPMLVLSLSLRLDSVLPPVSGELCRWDTNNLLTHHMRCSAPGDAARARTWKPELSHASSAEGGQLTLAVLRSLGHGRCQGRGQELRQNLAFQGNDISSCDHHLMGVVPNISVCNLGPRIGLSQSLGTQAYFLGWRGRAGMELSSSVHSGSGLQTSYPPCLYFNYLLLFRALGLLWA